MLVVSEGKRPGLEVVPAVCVSTELLTGLLHVLVPVGHTFLLIIFLLLTFAAESEDESLVCLAAEFPAERDKKIL